MLARRVLMSACLLASQSARAHAQAADRIVLQEASVAARYRLVENGAGVRTANQLQDKISFRVRLEPLHTNRLRLNVGAFTGSSFTGSWNNTGAGTGARTLGVRIRQFYASATPLRGVDVEVGSLYALRGQSTEVTSYDNDAYVTGERLTLRLPRAMLADELTATNGYLGDFGQPDAFQRTRRLADVNYGQILLQKSMGAAASVSADWTHAPDGGTARIAVRLALGERLAAIRLEAYRRWRDRMGGAAATAERRLGRRTVVQAGYATVDQRFPPLNGDRYGTGRRLFAGATVAVAPALSGSVFYTHAFRAPSAVVTGQRVDVVIVYDVLSSVKARGRRPAR